MCIRNFTTSDPKHEDATRRAPSSTNTYNDDSISARMLRGPVQEDIHVWLGLAIMESKDEYGSTESLWHTFSVYSVVFTMFTALDVALAVAQTYTRSDLLKVCTNVVQKFVRQEQVSH
jgi:hypothetical protein